MKTKYPFYAMGCSCEIIARNANPFAAKSAIRILLNEIRRLEKKYSFFNESSYLSAINNNAYESWVEPDEETIMLLHKADEMYRDSGEFYDPTVGSIAPLWDFKNMAVPDAKILQEKLKSVGWSSHVEISANRCRFYHPETKIDFGGLVKEYAIDRCYRMFMKTNPEGGLINLGGDIACFTADKENSRPWKIGVSDPRDHKRVVINFMLDSGVVLTSGDYHRYFIRDGVRYHHLLNPKTGYPFELKYSGVTFVGRDSALDTTQALTSFYNHTSDPDHIPAVVLYYVMFDLQGKFVAGKLPEEATVFAEAD